MSGHLDTASSAADHAAAPHAAAGGRRRVMLSIGALISAAAAIRLAVHVATIVITPYGFHRDEFLYIAMGKYLRLFAMDFPPLIALLANLTRFVLGDSLFAIRILPALAAAALVALTLVIVRELGGGRLAMLLAFVAMMSAPLFQRAGALFQPVVFDQLWWTLAFYATLRVGRRGHALDWLLLGVAGGIGLLTKFSIGFAAVGVLAGLLLTRHRRAFATPWPWVAAAVALVIGSPSVIGQIALGVPVAGQMQDLQAVQLERVTPAGFLAGQAIMIGPGILLAIGGAARLLTAPALRFARPATIAALTAFTLLLALQGKAYYAGPIYPLLIAAGATAVAGMQRFRATVAAIMLLLMALYGAVTLPLGLPVLPPEPMSRYAAALGVTAAVRTNTGQLLALPQDYADMLGWEEQVEAVAAAYRALPPADRGRAVIIASNYGEAGAIDFLGPRHGLPRAVAPVGSYWFFGPGELPGEVIVTLGVERADLDGFYTSIEEVGRVVNPWGVPEQQDVPILVARDPQATLQQVWPQFKGRN